MGSPDKLALIFLHLPRTGGSTLQRIIERQYGRRHTREVTPRSCSELASAPPPERESLRVLHGHFYMGARPHQSLPQPSTYITVLRDPIERVISGYFYRLETPGHRQHAAIVSRHLSLEDYVRQRISLVDVDNGQTRLLSDLEGPSSEECTIEMLESAKKNLSEMFSVVGLTERFDETVLLLRNTLRWRMPLYARRNVSRKRAQRRSIPAQTLDLIVKSNERDIELYSHAQALFETSIRKQPRSLERQLKVFRALNGIYSRTSPREAARRVRQWLLDRRKEA